MRKAMKKPMTERAETLVLKTLYQMHEKGHDANAALDQSTVRNWLDVFIPKDKEIPDMRREEYRPDPKPTAEQHAAQVEIRKRVLGAFKLVK
jgi:hypothetical protein